VGFLGTGDDTQFSALPGALPVRGTSTAAPAGQQSGPSLSSEKQLNRSCGGNGWKTMQKLEQNILSFVEKFGFENVGFFTITFPVKITCAKEAGRRFNSLATHVLKRYRGWIAVLERHQDGSIHFHLVVALAFDIRTGFDFARLQAATPQDRAEKGFWRALAGEGHPILAEWAFWRKTAKAYGFGRHELLPIRTRQEAIARYIGGYIGKHFEHRLELDKGVRLVRYSKNCGRKFWGNYTGAATGLPWLWRQKVRIFAGKFDNENRGINEKHLQNRFGKHWAYKMRAEIMAMDLKFARQAYPDVYTYFLDRYAFHGEYPADYNLEFEGEHADRAIFVTEKMLGVVPRGTKHLTIDKQLRSVKE
jgi:hypothetical protein